MNDTTNQLQLSGKVLQVFSPVTGQGKKGTWKKQDFLIEQPGQYAKRTLITAWGDNTDKVSNLRIGDEITAFLSLDAREKDGKWYNSINAWKLETEKKEDNKPALGKDLSTGQEDDLPF